MIGNKWTCGISNEILKWVASMILFFLLGNTSLFAAGNNFSYFDPENMQLIDIEGFMIDEECNMTFSLNLDRFPQPRVFDMALTTTFPAVSTNPTFFTDGNDAAFCERSASENQVRCDLFFDIGAEISQTHAMPAAEALQFANFEAVCLTAGTNLPLGLFNDVPSLEDISCEPDGILTFSVLSDSSEDTATTAKTVGQHFNACAE